MFNQDEFNTLCDRYVIAKVAQIRYDWLLSVDAGSDLDTYLSIVSDVIEVERDLESVILGSREVDRGDLRDDLYMLELVASALFIVNPNLPEAVRQPGNTLNPVVNWFVTYLTKSAKFWQSKGSQIGVLGSLPIG